MISALAKIHPTSIIEEGAKIGDHVMIGPFCYIGSQVEIGAKTELKSHIVINGITKIGTENQIYSFVTIGEVNQDLKYQNEPTQTLIGDRNRIREHVSIHRGTVQGIGKTIIGNDNLLMVNTHIAHDCVIGSHCILANNATLGGHVELDDYVIIGGITAIHQFCVIGAHAMVGGCSGVAQDIPPYVIAQGNHATPKGINLEGLKRRGFSREEMQTIVKAYKMLYREGLSLDEAKTQITHLAQQHVEIQLFLDLFKRSQRGIIR